MTSEQPLPAADEAAIGWFVLLRDEAASDEDRRRFQLWLRADPGHQAAWRAAERLWSELDQIAPMSAGSAEVMPLQQPPAPAQRPAGRLALKIAAGLVIAALGTGWALTPPGLFADYRAAVGGHELVQLEDGSAVELGTGAALDVNFTAARREVRLVTGEAFFTVTPDPARPFVVLARDGEILVRGTAFNVRIGSGVQVAVTEHTVEVSAGGSDPIRVTEGEEVSFEAGEVLPVRVADLDSVQAWRQGQLVFIDTPLDEVITELSRYRHGYIRLLGGELGQMRVTAVFDATRPDEAIETIARSLGLRVYRASGLLIGLARS